MLGFFEEADKPSEPKKSRRKNSNLLWWVVGGAGLFLAYEYFTGAGSSSAAPQQPAVPPSGTGSGSSTNTGTSGPAGGAPGYYPPGPMQDPAAAPGNVIMQVNPNLQMLPHIGQRGSSLAYGAWVAQLPPAFRKALAKMPSSERQARYHAYADWWNRYYGAA